MLRTVLIAEDEPEVRDYLGLAVQCGGYHPEFAENGEEVLNFLAQRSQTVSLLLLDLIMPKKDGLETLKVVRECWPWLPIITVSGCCTPANVASAMKGGAIDFLPKPVSHEDLFIAIDSALSASYPDRRFSDNLNLASRSGPYKSIETWAQQTALLLGRVGASDAPVLLRGETGAGKEVFARKLHQHSKRAARPFFKLNCAALPSELIESELFGYEKGAFTGAFRTNPGKFEMAEGGTILLDEIGDMDFKLQAKLLGVLQDREIVRLGSKTTLKVDVRIMAATHCNLEEAITAGRFREDLYYRLNILDIYVPPLRERKTEISELAQSFVSKYSPTDPIALPQILLDALMEHDWPGNIRELENIIRKFLVFQDVALCIEELRGKVRTVFFPRSVAVAAGTRAYSFAPEVSSTTMSSSLLPVTFRANETNHGGNVLNISSVHSLDDTLPGQDQQLGASLLTGSGDVLLSRPATLAQLDDAHKSAEIKAFVSALESTRWNRKQAAKLLGMDYKALLYKMKRLGIGETTA